MANRWAAIAARSSGPEGARIGRARDNDWVISNQYLSRTHAQVRYVNGAFYIEGMGRNPLALNSPTQTVPNHEPQLLRTGDRFFLDEYEVKVDDVRQARPRRRACRRAPRIRSPRRRNRPRRDPGTSGIVDAGVR